MTRWKMFSGFLLFFFAVTGCLTLIPQYYVEHRDFDSLDRKFSTDELVFFRGGGETVSVVRYSPNSIYTIGVQYVGSSWRFMDGHVNIEVDSVVYRLKDDDPARSVISGGIVLEQIQVYISKDILRAMAYATNVRLHYYLEPVTLLPEHIKLFYRFYQEYGQ